jgi:hypothetical protein
MTSGLMMGVVCGCCIVFGQSSGGTGFKLVFSLSLVQKREKKSAELSMHWISIQLDPVQQAEFFFYQGWGRGRERVKGEKAAVDAVPVSRDQDRRRFVNEEE